MVALAVILASTRAHADVERYAVIVGHNIGAADEQRLRFAEADAAQVAELLGEIGGVPDENQVVVRGRDADQVRRALIATNERIRIGQRVGHDAVLVVYYSGHGDADALHLGGSRLALRELEALVRGSSAQVRILIIDACRSGSLTRVKGGVPAPPLALSSGIDEPPGEGVIVLTASTAGEDAQESDLLAGSFFTHYLLSGLRGAADDDGDRVVTVAEAFRYTREQTILASSRTLGGTQHPTFHYDLRGRADIALADFGAAHGHGRLTVPDGATWLVVRGTAPGTVVGEIVAGAHRRTLSLAPGSYFVRGRTPDALLEGVVAIEAGRDTTVDTARLERTSYARLVRKGAADGPRSATGLFTALLVQTPIIDQASPCIGVLAGWTFTLPDVALSPRLAACHGRSSNSALTAANDALFGELRVSKIVDVGRLALDLGIAAGGSLLQERFDSLGRAPTRTSLAGQLGVGAGLALPLGERLYLGGEAAAQTYFFAIEDQAGGRHAVARFAVRGVLGLGAWF